jgi:hypothetical protein
VQRKRPRHRGANVKKGLVLVAAALVAAPALPHAQGRSAEAQRRRDQIQLMEGVLTRAVRLGAEQLSRQMQAVDPSMTVLTGQARARGFVLDGYGVFFDVEVPALSASAVWSMITVQQDSRTVAAIESLRHALATMPEGPKLQEAQQAFQVLVQQVAPAQAQAQAQPARSGPGPIEASAGLPAPNTVTASSVVDPQPQEPGNLYTDAVKAALVDAMLDHSLPMDLAPDEWLTVAARQSEGPLAPSEIYEASTIILRVRGEDLAAYAADRSRRAEIRQKVEVRIF